MKFRFGAASLALFLCTAFAQAQQPAQPPVQDSQAKRQAEQPGNNAPVWREVRSGEANYTSIKGPETGVLIQQQARFFGQDSRPPEACWTGPRPAG